MIKYDAFRVEGGNVQTPICRLEHPDTGSAIGFVALSHIGTQTYYDNLREHVRARQAAGSVVHVEGMSGPTDDDRERHPRIARWMTDFQAATQATAEPIQNALGLTSVQEAFSPDESWEVHDLEAMDTYRLLGGDRVRQMTTHAKMARKAFEQLTAQQISSMVRPVFTAEGARKAVSMPGPQQMILNAKAKAELAAVDAALSRDPVGELTIARGNLQVYGVMVGLRERGYDLVDVQWQTAFPLGQESGSGGEG